MLVHDFSTLLAGFLELGLVVKQKIGISRFSSLKVEGLNLLVFCLGGGGGGIKAKMLGP